MTAAVLLAAVPAVGQAAERQSAELRLLDVPFLPQGEQLCGGAAAAMVMRFWGSAEVRPEAFSDLVDRKSGGIKGQDLVRALEGRGWRAAAFRGDAALVASQLAKRRPLVALIEDRPGRFHYVVVVGWATGRVVVHDPARAPFRVLDKRSFTRAWAKANYWTLLIVATPADARADQSATGIAGSSGAALDDAFSCTRMVDDGVRLANAGNLEEAQQLLEQASDSCPDASAPWRERAGLHALNGEWALAASAARKALERNARDEHAARILATSSILQGRPDDALAAWNTLGEPRLDLVRVDGLERVRYSVVDRAVGLAPGATLTVESLTRARRRVSELPGIAGSRVRFTAGEDARADVNVAVIERAAAPAGPSTILAAGLRALSDREGASSFANLSGGGELLSASWRWWDHRPRAALTFSAPSPSNRLGGTWAVSLFTERQTYAQGSLVEERRRGASLEVSDWATGDLRWQIDAGVDRWRDRGISMTIGGSVQKLTWNDRLTLGIHASALAGGVRTAVGGLSAEWRSNVHNEGVVWLAGTGLEVAGAGAPLALWPGAGTGQGREILLRAHPLLDDGIIRDGVFGRRLLHAAAEWRRWVQPATKPLRMAPAFFIDYARAARGLKSSRLDAQTDLGAGLRVSIPGMGVVRVDVARGLRDGAMATSIAWEKRR